MGIAGKGIKVLATPSLYESAIERHGQYVRIYNSLPCFCVDNRGQVDPACSNCRGKGSIYFPLRNKKIVEEGMSFGGITITTHETMKSIVRILKGTTTIEYDSFSGKIITLKETLNKGIYYSIEYVQELELDTTCPVIHLERGFYKASIPSISDEKGNFIGELTEITSLTNTTQSKILPVFDFWEDMIFSGDICEDGDEIELIGKYSLPIKVLLTGISQKERSENFGVIQDADAQASYSGFINMGKGDLITSIRAEQRASVVGEYSGDGTYEIPFFHIKEILMVRDSIGDIDNISLIKNNQLLFNERKPNGKFSMAFTYNPTFTIMDSMPSLRYGEDKVFPKRVYLKRYDMYNRMETMPRATNKFGPIEMEP